MLRHLIFFSLITLFNTIGNANETTEKRMLARQLVDLLQYDVQLKIAEEACLDSANTIPLETIYSSDEEMLAIIRKDKNFRHAVQGAYDTYLKKTCAIQIKEELLNMTLLAHQEKMSVEALKEAIRFYSGDAGKKMIEAHRALTNTMYKDYAVKSAKLQPEINAEYYDNIENIKEAHGASKECHWLFKIFCW